ncbi:probable L-gulonolactone oxidase 1 [Folsomia candida]|nr:probable L-gulonolactone oxidase 1 [Folsomia candida]
MHLHLIISAGLAALAQIGVVLAADPSLVYTSYQTTPICTPSSEFKTPQSILELQTILLTARLFNQKVKPLGSRHSATDIICTDGIPISMEAFDSAKMNSDGTATVGAGMTMGAAVEFLQARGRTLIVVPQFRGITIGGALGTGAHGSSLKYPTALSDQITALTVIDGNGVLRVIRGPDLNHFRVHLGLLGVILDATFQTVPAYKLTVNIVPQPDSILDDGSLLQMARDNDYFVAQWWPHKNEVLTTIGNMVPMSTPGNAFQNLYPASPIGVTSFLSQLTDFVHGMRNLPGGLAMEEYSELTFYQQVVGRIPYYTEDNSTLVMPATGLGWMLTSSICDQAPNGCSWHNGNNSLYFDEEEIGCDIAEFPGIIRTLRGILKDNMAAFTFTGLVMRFQKASQATLYMASGRDTVAVEFIYPQRLDRVNNPAMNVATYQAIVQALVFKHGGRPHWGKNGQAWAKSAIIKSQYPKSNRDQFINAMRQYDTLGLLRNKFAGRLLGISDTNDVDPTEIHCSLRQNCICQVDADCANNQDNAQICGEMADIDGQISYKVCKETKLFVNPPLGPYNPYNMSDIARAIRTSYV